MNFSVIGLGKLGSPLAAALASKGHNVIGVDINPEVVKKINNHIAPVLEPSLQELISNHCGRLKATLDYEEAILQSDVTFVIVPTPSDKNGLFSNHYVLQSMKRIGQSLTKKSSYHLVVITSTVIPGSTNGEIRSVLEQYSNQKLGDSLGLCYNPEFIALGSVIQNIFYPDLVVIGESDQKAGDLLEQVYQTICANHPPICRMNLMNAEITKISINNFITAKISYANMLSDLCERLPGSDVNVVTDAIGLDSRIGAKYLKAAVAFGGPCFPRDTVALAALARKIGTRAHLAEATQEINEHQYDRLFSLIKAHAKTKRVGILGLSYKPGTCVVEESQGIRCANELAKEGYEVSVYDPVALKEAEKSLTEEVGIIPSLQECLQRSDTIMIMIPWPEFSEDISPLSLEGKTVIDCWRVLSQEKFNQTCKLIYLGSGQYATDFELQPNQS